MTLALSTPNFWMMLASALHWATLSVLAAPKTSIPSIATIDAAYSTAMVGGSSLAAFNETLQTAILDVALPTSRPSATPSPNAAATSSTSDGLSRETALRMAAALRASGPSSLPADDGYPSPVLFMSVTAACIAFGANPRPKHVEPLVLPVPAHDPAGERAHRYPPAVISHCPAHPTAGSAAPCGSSAEE
ncbi:unnamed protein product [Mycena citricolor]|uniref:Uncharacterized protein n=1 Tax=Mycena citricolor TaxID=2018698 RepID=A0AAD2H8V8_9AGAR|nr:unnamed protein product [Mycena citricolor]